jgi:hypothetical protein
MPKPPPQSSPDPMAGVVDRLLAQLPGLQGQAEPPRSPSVRVPLHTVSVGTALREPAVAQRQVIGMWLRVLLGLSVAVMMGWWPYPRACGLPLAGYLGAVTTVIMGGGWAAISSWKVRSGLAHTIALIVMFFGIVLAASELLPRTGYAVRHATWTCENIVSTSSLS